MSKAFEMMNTQVVKVHPEDKLVDVVKILLEHKISGLPVIDDENKVLGMISGRDLLKYSETLDNSDNSLDISRLVRPHTYTAKSLPESNTNLFLITRVEEVMSKTVISVKENASFHDVVILMKEHKINRIPVIDEDGHLKGLITRTDLLNYIADKKD